MISPLFIYISFIAINVVTVTGAPAGAGRWKKLADLPTSTAANLTGRGIGLMAGGVVDGKIYLVGGQEGSRRGDVYGTKATRIFSPTTNSWGYGKDAPDARERAASVVVNDNLYIIGGAKAGDELISYSNTWSYTPATDTWKELASLPDRYYDAAACSVNETIYVFGGFPSNSDVPIPYNTTLAYSIKSDTWSQEQPLPAPLAETACVSVGTDIYLFGGVQYIDEQYVHSDQIHIYDTVKKTWSKSGSTPKSTRAFAVALVQDRVYLVSAESNQLLAYDLKKKRWVSGYPKIPGHPRVAPSVVSVRDVLYVIGGQVDLYTDKEYIYLYSNDTLALEV
ncbi:galactose oxidase [Basidiobolus meristosporus CBS 931.73]|uniref:Galactose oxidase n=1 Tax=Basidiobolus meristosporus CBS 931.73 TaxID=1314790 RepID=A0A1Y1YA76_9FUNG|nr:galactose oxidase [Basidiobolus meristosporus CBS 931.73]|eukprot:ORX94656.1 galactose oxidase [Basidiobolus meristosporus CBS 931.73]